MRKILSLFIIALLMSSCASILNGKRQKVTINTSSENTIYIDNQIAQPLKGKYLLTRDRKPKEICLKREGYKDAHYTVMQYKKSPLFFFSIVPFGLLFYPPFYDRGNKAYDYDSQFTFGQNMVQLPQKDAQSKEIRINNVGVKLDANALRYRYFPSYKRYVRKQASQTSEASDTKDKINVENTIFADLMNDVLKEKGYVDTTRKILKDSYLNNLLIDATIVGYTINNISNTGWGFNGGMIYTDLVIEWQALDYYKKPVYTYTTTKSSGEYAILNYDKADEVLHNSLKDAIESGLIEFMSTEKMVSLLHDRSEKEAEDAFTTITMPKAKTYVSTLSQAVKSSVTIKSEDGHGSGFIVSPEGHIITNYHVVSDTLGMKVILNDKSEYKVSVVRVSKINDLALLKIEAKNLIPFKISDSHEIDIASDIYAVGTPTAEDLSQTVSKGIISGVRESDDSSKLIQTDASINSGNSGGAIINKEGLVLGVVSSKLKGFGIEGVAFGIPAYELFDKLKIAVAK